MSSWAAPQFIVVAIFSVVGIAAYVCNGKPKGNWSFGTTFVEIIMWIALLNWGGFFR